MSTDDAIEVGPPRPGEGRRIWEVAHAAGGLDVNSAYAYVLWVRDFSSTTAVARDGDEVVAYCTAYLRPDAPETLFVWQVAVAPSHRRRGLGVRILDELAGRTGATALEATVTPDNAGSWRLFGTFAERRGAPMVITDLFSADEFPEGHDPEQLLRIEPL